MWVYGCAFLIILVSRSLLIRWVPVSQLIFVDGASAGENCLRRLLHIQNVEALLSLLSLYVSRKYMLSDPSQRDEGNTHPINNFRKKNVQLSRLINSTKQPLTSED